LQNYIKQLFLILGLTLTKHLSGTNTFLEITEHAKMEVNLPSLITPQEFLEYTKDIKVSLPEGTDLSTTL